MRSSTAGKSELDFVVAGGLEGTDGPAFPFPALLGSLRPFKLFKEKAVYLSV